MKIEDIYHIKRKTTRKSPKKGAFLQAAQSNNAAPCHTNDAIFTVTQDNTINHAYNIVSELEKFRDELYFNNISIKSLHRIQDLLAQFYNHNNCSQELFIIIREIEMRAAVELVKWGLDA